MAFGGDNAEDTYDQGLTALMKGDVRRAVKLFVRVIDLDRSMVAAYHQLGRCYIRMGEPQRATEVLSQVVQKKPDLLPARLDLGQALLHQGATDRAREQFMHVLEKRPDNGKAHMGMAQACFSEGNWEGAVSLAQTARAHLGANFSVMFLLGRAAKLAGNAIMAEEALNEAAGLIAKSVEGEPEGPEGHFLRGEVCFVQERYAAAIDHYRAAEDRADPARSYAAFGEGFSRVDIMVKRALCYQRMGNLDGARELARQVLAVQPEHKLARSLSQL